MHVRRMLALAGAVTAVTLAACGDIPLAPRWDADFYFPLTSKSIYLSQTFPAGFVLPGQSGQVSFPWQVQPLDQTIGEVLSKVDTVPSRARNFLAAFIRKTTPITAQDTLFIVRDTTTSSPGDISLPMTLLASDTTKTDSTAISLAQIGQLRSLATAGQSVYIQLRGQASNPGSSILPITGADSINIKLTMTVRIAVSSGK